MIILAQSCDIGDAIKLDAFLDAVKGEFGSEDILVNNVSAFSIGGEYSDL